MEQKMGVQVKVSDQLSLPKTNWKESEIMSVTNSTMLEGWGVDIGGAHTELSAAL